jgi:uncharacterized membrane protein YidH (DUF202 family)
MWLEKLARVGFATKGIVYAIIGILAVQTAVSAGGKTTDSQGALRTIAAQPFGQFLLILVTIGLAAYAIWRLFEAIKDPEGKYKGERGGKRAIARLGYAFSGIAYGALAVQAARLVTKTGGSGGGNSEADWTARLLQQPFGQWLVGVVGALIIGMGFYMFYKAYKVKFRRELDLHELNPQQETWAVRISRLGIAARGVVFSLIGFFLIQAARKFDPNQAKGIDGALQSLAQQPYGKFLLGIVALGLIAYGIYLWIQARYRRFKTV